MSHVEQLENTDDRDERSVFERGDYLSDDGRDHQPERLGEHYECGDLGRSQADCFGGLDLSFGDCLKATSDVLGEVGRPEESEDDGYT